MTRWSGEGVEWEQYYGLVMLYGGRLSEMRF
jgi:hypothetical protein